MNEDIVLYHLDTRSDKSDIHLRFESDELVLDGYDRGPLTKQLTDDYDYEYRIMVAASQLLPLHNRFGLQVGQRQALLEVIAGEVSGQQAFTLFQKMLLAAGVTFSTWSG